MTRTIALKGDFIRKEGESSGVITPGHLVEFGGSQDIDVHGAAAGEARKAFALENDLIGDGIDDDYAQNDTVQYGVFVPGAEVYAWLEYGQTTAIGDAMVSAGDGTLQLFIESSDEKGAIVAYALEVVANTSGGAAVRVRVEVA